MVDSYSSLLIGFPLAALPVQSVSLALVWFEEIPAGALGVHAFGRRVGLGILGRSSLIRIDNRSSSPSSWGPILTSCLCDVEYFSFIFFLLSIWPLPTGQRILIVVASYLAVTVCHHIVEDHVT